MPRSSSVSEKVWAQAIHAVTVQKMSLRRAAQLYGVHHMSLHRRVRGRYMSTSTARFADEFQLSRAEEDEVISVLREQYIHERHVTSDDVRYVVRTIACQNGRRDIPSDFPQNRWIASFKRMYGFSNASPAEQLARTNSASSSSNGSSDASPHYNYSADLSPSAGANLHDQGGFMNPPMTTVQESQVDSPAYSTVSAHMGRANNIGRPMHEAPQRAPMHASYAPQPMASSSMQMTNNSNMSTSNGMNDDQQRDDTSESDSERNRESVEQDERNRESVEQDERFAEEKRCRQSNTVSAETWEKAMDAVEIHGMSLRNAAKAYGVHFAALHRRVKKRALKKESTPPLENYIPFEDEAGIVRVIHARADLGIIMSYEELVDLLNRTALKYSPMITAELSRSLVRRFQSRVEQSIRHLIRDWPLPRLDTIYHFHSTPTNALTAAGAAMEEEKMAASPPQQRSMPSIYVRNPDFNPDPHRQSFSDPFMRPMLRDEAKTMLSPVGHQEYLSSSHDSVLRL